MASAEVLLVAHGVVRQNAHIVAVVDVNPGALLVQTARQGVGPKSVIVPLVHLVGIGASDYKVLERFHFEHSRVDHVVAVVIHLPSFKRSHRGIDPGAVLVEGVDLIMRADERRQVDGAVAEIGTADIRLVRGVPAHGIAALVGELQPFEQLIVHVQAPGPAAGPGIQDYAFVVHVSSGEVVIDLAFLAAHRHVVVVVRRNAGDFLLPVRVPAGPRRVELERRSRVLSCAEIAVVVVIAGELVGVHHVQPARERGKTELAAESDSGLGCDCAFGLYHNDAVCALGAVDCGCAGILEH